MMMRGLTGAAVAVVVVVVVGHGCGGKVIGICYVCFGKGGYVMVWEI
jgi:hypothetical protein